MAAERGVLAVIAAEDGNVAGNKWKSVRPTAHLAGCQGQGF